MTYYLIEWRLYKSHAYLVSAVLAENAREATKKLFDSVGDEIVDIELIGTADEVIS